MIVCINLRLCMSTFAVVRKGKCRVLGIRQGIILVWEKQRIICISTIGSFSNYSGRHRCEKRPWLTMSLHWRHNDQDGVSNHQPHVCLLNRLFRRRPKKTSKLRVTGLCVGNSPGPRTKGQLRGKCFHLMTSSWFTETVWCSCWKYYGLMTHIYVCKFGLDCH